MTIENEVRDELAYLIIWHHRLPMDQEGSGNRLLTWLVGDRRSIPHRSTPAFATLMEAEEWPDVCSMCGTYYGLTVSGRTRAGCPACERRGNNQLEYGWRLFTGLNLNCPEFFRLAKHYRRHNNGTQ